MPVNPTNGRGFMPVKMLAGGAYTGSTTEYKIASGYNTAIAAGDAVASLATGFIGVAAVTAPIRGILAGVQYVGADGVPVYRPNWIAGTTTLGGLPATALVVDDPNVVFQARMLNNAVAPTQAAVGNTFNGFLISTPDASGQSTGGIDASTYTGTATVWRLLGFVPKPDNDPLTANPLVHVQATLHELRATAGI